MPAEQESMDQRGCFPQVCNSHLDWRGFCFRDLDIEVERPFALELVVHEVQRLPGISICFYGHPSQNNGQRGNNNGS